MKLKKNSDLVFWLKTSAITIAYIYYVFINFLHPMGGQEYTWHWGIWLPLTTYVVLWEGRKYFKIYKNMFKGILNMDTLIGLGSHILYVYAIVMMAMNYDQPYYSYDSMWEAAGALIIFTNIGHFVQNKITASSLDAYAKLDEMRNAEVLTKRGKEYILLKASDVKVGEQILIKRGSSVPLDGTLINAGVFDYSNITGEAREIKLNQGESVVSGSFNIAENVQILVSKSYADSTINHIIEKIEDVAASRPKMQQVADKIIRIFTPTVLIVALLTFAIWLALGLTDNINLPWVDSAFPVQNAFHAAITTIAIACPCALGMATPLVYTVSSMLAVKHGLVINEPKSLEEINRIKIFAFDKTGTITSSEMDVAKMHGDEKLVPVAAMLEENVDHPIAKAISSLKKETSAKVKNIKYIDNQGIQGTWNNKSVFIKKYEGTEFDVNWKHTVVALYVDDVPKLVFELKNKIKENVVKTIAQLNKLKIKTVMITGDNDEVAKEIASQVGIMQVFANVKPIGKADIIKKLQEEGEVAFVGDGFNDSIAIKQANLSIAFNTGSEITNSLSDVSIMTDDFYEIVNFVKLGKLNNSKVRIALIYAFLFNTISLPIAMIMLVQPWVGASVMAASDILVALNSWHYKITGLKKLKKAK